MSKKIDFSKPLSRDDAEYVADRPWLVQDAELQGLKVTLAEDAEEEFEVDEDESDEDELKVSDEDNEDEAEESEEDDEESDEDEIPPYSEWSFEALKDEAKSRGLSAKGSTEALIARLEEDDDK